MVDASENLVDDVFEHDGEGEIGGDEEREVFSDVFFDGPEYAVWGGFGGAGTEKLDPG